MTEEIKTRIEQIQNGKVPDGYKKSLTGKWIIPDSWNVIKLSDVATHKILKNTELKYKETYTNSATQGIIKQTDYFDKNISNKENISGYYIVDENDYVYNPRISTSAPCGPINKSHIKKTGIMSPLYTVFSMNKENKQNAFFEEYFRSSFWHRYIKEIANYGARFDRMNISTEDLFNISIPFPPLPEQQKIAEILSTQDKIIELKQKEIEEKQKQKKYLMQKLLSNDGKKFTIGDVVIDKEKWKEEKLGNICTFLDNQRRPIESKERIKGIYPYYGASGIIDYVNDYIFDGEYILLGEDGANIVLRSTPLAFKIQGKTWVNNHAHVLKPNENIDIDFLINYLENLVYDKFNTGTAQPKLNRDVCEKIQIKTSSLPEQKIIAEILSAADKEIELLKNGLEQEKQKKISLTQLLLTGIARVKV